MKMIDKTTLNRLYIRIEAIKAAEKFIDAWIDGSDHDGRTKAKHEFLERISDLNDSLENGVEPMGEVHKKYLLEGVLCATLAEEFKKTGDK